MNAFKKAHPFHSTVTADRYVADEEIDTYDNEEPSIEDIAEIEMEDESPGIEVVEDSIQLYLQEIGQVALLTAEQELILGKQVAEGKTARDRLEQEAYTSWDERITLERQVAIADEARRELIQANLRLVVSVAKKYINSAMSFMDLVQEGNIGLMRAVEKFDYKRGNRFSTYATWWIRQAVTRAIAEQSRLIRLPVHLSDALSQLRRTIYDLEQQFEREPTAEEIASVTNMSLRKVKRLLRASSQPISIEQPLNNEQEGRIGEMLADESLETPMEIAAQNMLNEELTAALNELSERERKILQLRYGLADGKRRTLEEVGMAFGITRERTRQIEAEAMRRLRHPSVGLRLKGYLE